MAKQERLNGRLIFKEALKGFGDSIRSGQEPPDISHKELVRLVEETLDSLSEREDRVMRLRFGLEDGHSRTQAQVGQEIGRSRWTVGRIERRALRKLRHPSRSQALQALRDYLP